MKSNSFGLDIGTSTFKAVVLEKTGDGIKLVSAASSATPKPGIQSESPFDHQDMAKVILKVLEAAKISEENVSIALPENHVFTKIIEIPAISDKELETAIYWEAEQYIPASLDTVALAYTVIRRPKDGSKQDRMQVLLVAAPHQLIQRYQSVLDYIGIKISSVETESLSVVRALIRDNTSPTSFVINIGSMNTTISIVQAGDMIFNYYVPLGGVALTRAISSGFGFSIEKAEEYKKTYGLSDKNFGGKVTSAIEPVLASIISEIKKARTFYNEKYQNDSPITQILLTGGASRLPGIDLYFVKNIDIETVIANPFKTAGIKNVPDNLDSAGPEYSVAVGLALKDYEE